MYVCTFHLVPKGFMAYKNKQTNKTQAGLLETASEEEADKSSPQIQL